MFKTIFDQIEEVLQALFHRQSEISQVNQTLQSRYEPIANGAWIGQGAQAFMEEFTGEIVPELNALADLLGGYHINVRNARNVVEEADKEALKAAHKLADMVDSIF